MKKTLLFLLLLATTFQGFSQFYEGFEGVTFPPPGWLIADNGIGTSYSWERTSIITSPPSVFEGNFAAYMTRDQNGLGNTSEDWLIMPQMLVNNISSLSFQSRSTLSGNQGTLYQIRVSTNSEQSNLGAYTILEQFTENELSSVYNIYEEKIISLSAFENQSVFIAFVMVFTQPSSALGGDRWLLDAVSVSSTTTIDFITLVSFLDLNNNGVQDNNEPNFSYGTFQSQLNSENPTYGNSSSGTYLVFFPTTTFVYSFSYVIPSYLNAYYASNATFTGTINPNDSSSFVLYFPITILQNYNDVSISFISNSNPRPNLPYINTLTYKNTGQFVQETGTITFTKDPAVTITNISVDGTILTPTGFTFDYINLQINETRSITVTMQVPNLPIVSIGDILTNSVSISPFTDVIPANNLASISQVITAAYDPNDKMENHGPTINIDEFGADDYLFYTIRFENIGTASAELVRIEDALNSSLNTSTFEMIHASHDYNVTRNGNQLTWNFYDIDLPPTSQNPDLSQGFVHFKIKPNPGFAVGDIIPNTAEIYFDYNPAIITNTFETEFISVLSVTDKEPFSVAIYPNPSNQFVYIKLDRTTDALKSIVVFDVLGKQIVSKESLHTFESTLDIGHLNAGTYILEIVTHSNLKTTKKLVIK
ncbi:T9SS-dependent choice-of-anchor J family protein [Flavobacterium sp. UBA6135]|uniref:T9SS-dependent choice-of-anchor J family protein n=1 Tax=Flavobacterium sp. UBA6135 TaxID=1946553 RepID=UPI0025C04BC3|nr:choice-of-anchor J domain-containing protein [Flavobacterium sp. UBA6135]